MNRDALRVRDARLGEDAVEEDARGGYVEQRFHGLPPSLPRLSVAAREGGDEGAVVGDDLVEERAAIARADEFEAAQSERIDPFAEHPQQVAVGSRQLDAVRREADRESGCFGDPRPRDAGKRLDHDQFSAVLVEAEDAEVGDQPHLARAVALRAPLLVADIGAAAAGDVDLPDQRQRRVPGDVEHVVAMHVGDVGHAALAGEAHEAAVLLAEADVVDAGVHVDLRRGDDLVGDGARLVVGRIGIVAAGMRHRGLGVEALEQAQHHRARRDVEMAAAHRRDDHVGGVRRLGEAVGDIGERRDGAGAGEAVVVEFGGDADRHPLVDRCLRLAAPVHRRRGGSELVGADAAPRRARSSARRWRAAGAPRGAGFPQRKPASARRSR